MRLAPEDPTLSIKDAVFPFRVYGLVLHNLPRTKLSLILGLWGLTAVVTAFLCMGGLGHWFTYLQSNQPKMGYPAKYRR